MEAKVHSTLYPIGVEIELIFVLATGFQIYTLSQNFGLMWNRLLSPQMAKKKKPSNKQNQTIS